VAGAEHVVLALGALEEARHARLLAQRLHPRVAPGEELVRVALVPDVPHELVARGVEHVVQRHGELDHAEPRADVAAGPRAHVDEPPADLVRERAQVVAREGLEVGRRLDAVEERHGRSG
jgi:hypothetical protein